MCSRTADKSLPREARLLPQSSIHSSPRQLPNGHLNGCMFHHPIQSSPWFLAIIIAIVWQIFLEKAGRVDWEGAA